MITPDRLRALLRYDAASGEMHWLVTNSNRAKAGSLAGSVDVHGYRQIKIEGRVYKFHHVAWLHAHGVWPDSEIDHKDGDPLNNRLDNLRLATSSQNSWNTRPHRDSATGFKGVSRNGKKYVAAIMTRGAKKRLGRFDTAEEAHHAYCVAAKLHHGQFAKVA